MMAEIYDDLHQSGTYNVQHDLFAQQTSKWLSTGEGFYSKTEI